MAADPEHQSRLHRVAETTAIRAGIPMPKVGVIDDPAPNAFGAPLSRKKAVIGVTTGAPDRLDISELEAMVAHEMAHIVNQDGRIPSQRSPSSAQSRYSPACRWCSAGQ